MTASTKRERRHLELAFESSTAIVMLEGLESNEESRELQQRIVAGELDFDEAVQVVLQRVRVPRP